MSQNDYIIANQSAPDFRSDLNEALQALASLSSGATAPSATYANMLWYDDANNILKMRTEADDAWINLGELDQINNLFRPANAVPIGAVNSFAMNSAPAGWLSCNGNAVSRTTYAGLFSAIGTTYGAGDGSTTFNVPDLRGEFVRGLDNGRGVDSSRSLGSAQGAFAGTVPRDGWGTSGGGLGSAPSGQIIVGSGGTEIAETLESIRASGNDREVTPGDTRPRNIALLYCIKY
jgi:phage-related tail fiber protein